MTATGINGDRRRGRAFKGVTVTRRSIRAADIRVSVDGVQRMERFVSDGQRPLAPRPISARCPTSRL